MNENREYIRYVVDQFSDFSAIVEIEGESGLRGTVSDLSSGGFSFSVDLNIAENRNIDLQKFFYVRLIFGEQSIYSEVEKRWSMIRDENGKRIYAAGVCLNVISSEDRLKLNDIIEKIRSHSLGSHP